MKGKFIVFEGTDGSGKATQVELLKNYLEKKKILHKLIAFPRYKDNPYGKLISLYLKGEFGGMHSENVYLMSLAFAGDRFLAKPKIEKWLKNDFLVIADRYVSSNKAHMSARLPSSQRNKFISWLDNLEYKINKIPKEDLTIFLYVPPKIARKNLKGKGSDMHEESLIHLQLSSKTYLDLAKSPDWVVINCAKDNSMRSPKDIHHEVVRTLQNRGLLNS